MILLHNPRKLPSPKPCVSGVVYFSINMERPEPRYGGVHKSINETDKMASQEQLRYSPKEAIIDPEGKSHNEKVADMSLSNQDATNSRSFSTENDMDNINKFRTSISNSTNDERANEEIDKEDEVARLLEVFRDLNIDAHPRPYTRLTRDHCISGSSDSGHTDQAQETTGVDSEAWRGIDSVMAVNQFDDVNVKYSKNLFLKDRRGVFYLVICPEDIVVDLKQLKQQLGASRNLSFADGTALHDMLHLRQGEVTPLAVMHESGRGVRVAVHKSLTDAAVENPRLKFAFHPLRGDLQIDITYQEFTTFIEHFGKVIEIVDIVTDTGKKSSDCHTKVKTENKTQHKIAKEQSAANTEKYHKTKREDTTKKKETVTNQERINPTTETNDYTPDFETGGVVDESDNIIQKCKYNTDNSPDFILREDNMPPEKDSATGSDNTAESPRNGGGAKRKNVIGKRQIWPLFERKGKLRSYIRKYGTPESPQTNSVQYVEDNPTGFGIKQKLDETPMASLGSCIEDTCLETNFSDTYEEIEQLDNCNTLESARFVNPLQHASGLSDVSRIQLLPEVEFFYSSLRDSEIQYKEIGLSNSCGIEPSVGCRCFLMKDKREHFFFVISHEFYEPDFGRLKAALKPKRKLMHAENTDVTSVLGINPAKMTPFAVLTSRGRKPQIFITAKITPDNLVLCIPHPYIQGHRILMASGELKRFLQYLGLSFGIVKEKVWPARYDVPFSQFDKPDFASDSESIASTSLELKYQISRCQESLKSSYDQSHCHEDMSLDKSIDGPLGSYHDNVQKIFDFLGSQIVQQICPHEVILGALFFSKLLSYSSVSYLRPVYQNQQKNAAEDNSQTTVPPSPVNAVIRFIRGHEENGAIYSETGVKIESSGLNLITDTVTTSKDSGNRKARPKSFQQENLDSISSPSSPTSTITSVPEETTMIRQAASAMTSSDIVQALQAHGIRFSLERRKILRRRNQVGETQLKAASNCHDNGLVFNDDEEVAHTHSSLDNSGNLSSEEKGVCAHGNHDTCNLEDSFLFSGDDDTIVERCAVMHLTNGKDRDYLIVGSEDDFPLSVKRFCRRSRVKGRLYVVSDPALATRCSVNIDRVIQDGRSGEATNCSLGLEQRSRNKWRRAGEISRYSNNMCTLALPFALENMDFFKRRDGMEVAMTTTLYIDPDTIMEFTVGSERSRLRMTSSEFERYLRSLRVDVMYH